jgi:hypothetical protein
MGKSPLNGMTSGERVAYAHGKVRRDMQDFLRQIEIMYRRALFERVLLIVLAVAFSFIILAAFYFLRVTSTQGIFLLGVIAAVFVIGGLVSNNVIRRQVAMLRGLQFLYSKLADDETIKVVVETMQIEDVDVKRIHLTGLTDEKLRDGLMLAGHVIDAIVSQIEKEKRELNGKPDTT